MRLAKSLEDSRELWFDIEAELQYSLNDGIAEAIGKRCDDRGYMSGYCGGLQQALDLRKRINLWTPPSKP